MAKKVIIFDLDQTLTETRSPMTDEMSGLLNKLLDKYQVCVISGGNFNQFRIQLLSNLKANSDELTKLHIMPACGSRYYKYNLGRRDWDEIYAEDFSDTEKKEIIKALEETIEEAGYKVSNPKGPLIEDRGSQVTYSALGQDAEPSEKKSWDRDGAKKRKIRDIAAEKLPNFEVKMGGTTSIDVTKKGVNKAYGMRKLMKLLEIKKPEMLFIGDRVFKDGNDYPVKQMGIKCINVKGYEETPQVVKKIIVGKIQDLKFVK